MRPPPLRTDAHNRFAHYSMSVRVPKILDEVLAENPDYPREIVDSVTQLRDQIRHNLAMPALLSPAPDAATWERELARRKGETWLATEWFFAECYVYRCLMVHVRYWETGRDPFAPVKRRELASEALWKSVSTVLYEQADEPPPARLHALLALALWGNRVDLSYAVGTAFGREGTSEDLLSDDRPWGIERLLTPGADILGDVHIVADNSGSELTFDLLLADAIVELAGARVTLHVKMQPTFVSDAVVEDVHSVIEAMDRQGGSTRELSARLRGALREGRLRVWPDFYWNGPSFLADGPPHLTHDLFAASVVIMKGDANYRRAVGDALWPPETPFAQATSYFAAPLLCLRTLKSDTIVGLSQGLAARLDGVDPDWRINGRRGLIQGNAR